MTLKAVRGLILLFFAAGAKANGVDNFVYSQPWYVGPTITFSLPATISGPFNNRVITSSGSQYVTNLGGTYISFNCITPETGCDAMDTFDAQFIDTYSTVSNGLMTFIPGVYTALEFFPGTDLYIADYYGQTLTITDPPGPSIAAPEPNTAYLIIVPLLLIFLKYAYSSNLMTRNERHAIAVCKPQALIG